MFSLILIILREYSLFLVNILLLFFIYTHSEIHIIDDQVFIIILFTPLVTNQINNLKRLKLITLNVIYNYSKLLLVTNAILFLSLVLVLV